ncbi:RHS repeat-associated core domain-containing protein [Enterobacter cloacae]
MTIPLTGSLHRGTPTIQVFDNRGQTIRTQQFHRDDVGQSAALRLTRTTYSPGGFPLATYDPRLQIPVRSWSPSLSGATLQTLSTDAGTDCTLGDAEGRPLWQLDARGTIRRWHRESPALPGRLLAVSEQSPGDIPRFRERYVYAPVTADSQAYNLCGHILRHYDPAGRQAVLSVGLGGQVLRQQRHLCADTARQPEWKTMTETDWEMLLAPAGAITTLVVDACGQGVRQTDAAGHVQCQRYNIAGQLVQRTLQRKGNFVLQTLLADMTYTADGNIQQETLGNGVVTRYEYSPQTGRLVSLKTTRSTTGIPRARILQDLRYTYDPVGNVLSVRNDAEETRFWRNQKVVPENTYVYDSLYQLIQATGRESSDNVTSGDGPGQQPVIQLPGDVANRSVNYSRHYRYDASGNLVRIRHHGASRWSRELTVSDRSNHALLKQGMWGAITPQTVDAHFDAAGNQRALQPGQNLVWNERQQLAMVNTSAQVGDQRTTQPQEYYLYDAGGLRVVKETLPQARKASHRETVVYLPGLEYRSCRQGNNTTESLAVILAGNVQVLHWDRENEVPSGMSNGCVRYSLSGTTGMNSMELDEKGNIISAEEYFPYGGSAWRASRSAVETRYRTHRYSGKERDATGLYYYGYRYYQSWAGRWLSADPAGTVDGLNLYRMVRNNPVTLSDPDGLAPVGSEARLKQIAYDLFVENIRRAGLHIEEYKAIHRVAVEKTWHINVRTGNSARVSYVGKMGVRPKPAGVYQKTFKGENNEGLVLYTADQAEKARQDLQTINTPSAHAPEALQVLSREGFRLRPINEEQAALVDGFGNAVYGDIDIHSVLDENGSQVAPEEWVPVLNAALESTGLHKADNLLGWGDHSLTKTYGVKAHSPIQHGAHDEWHERNDETYAGGINMGPQPGVLNIRGLSRLDDYELFTTEQYRVYMKAFASNGDSVYTEAAWDKGAARTNPVSRLRATGILSGLQKRYKL